MKFFIEATSLNSGGLSGIGQYTNNLTENIYEQQADVVCLAATPSEKEAINKYLEILHPTPLPPKKIKFFLAILYWPFMIDRRYGAGNYIFPNYINYRVSKKSKKLVVVHDLTFKKYPETMSNKLAAFALDLFTKRALKYAYKVGAVSQSTKNDMIEEYGDKYPQIKNKIVLLPPAIDRSIYYPRKEADVKRTLADLNINKPFFLFVNSFEPRKNIPRQLEAFAKSKASKTHALVLVGSKGWGNEAIDKKIEQYIADGVDIIRPDRFITNDEVACLMSGARALLYVSLYEGFGMQIVEAQGCKCLVITGDSSSMPEVAGEAGALFANPESISAITNCIDQAASNGPEINDTKKTGHANQQRFSWEQTAQKLIEAFN